MNRRAGLAVMMLAMILFGGSILASKMSSSSKEILSIETFVGDSLAAYRTRNSLEDPDLFARLEDSGSHFLVARNEHPDDPSGLSLTYRNDTCSVVLPTGRQIAFGYDAGVITSITVTMPLEPLSWESMLEQSSDLADSFDAAGFDSGKRHQELRPKDFLDKGADKWAQVGAWTVCGQSEVKVRLTARYLDSGSSASFSPPAVLSKGSPDTPEDRFLLQAYLSARATTFSKELWELREARRVAVHGDKNIALPLDVWLDDPSWRPEGWQGKHVP